MKTHRRNPSDSDLRVALAQLRQDPAALRLAGPRCRIAGALSSTLASGPAVEPFRSLAILLAKDPKWEVRKRMAEVLAGAQDNDLAEAGLQAMAGRFASLRSPGGRDAGLRRRAAAREEAGRRKKGIDLALDLYEQLKAAARDADLAEEARALAEAMYDVLVSTAVHEMRGVLTTLVADGGKLQETLEGQTPDLARARRRVGKVNDRLAFLVRLLQDMRSYSQKVTGERVDVEARELGR